MDDPLEVRLGRLLVGRGWTISVAETTAGGLICARIVSVPGSSTYLERGVVAYSRASKVELLGLAEDALDTYGAVSEETAVALAQGVRQVSGTTLGLAETGIAGPIRGRSPKPIGSACIALAGSESSQCVSFVFSGDRHHIREQIAEQALASAVGYLESGVFCA